MPRQRGRSGSPLPLAGLTPNEHLAPLTPPQDLLPESPAATCLRPQTDQLAGCPTVCSSRPPLPTARRGCGRPAGAPSAAPRGPQTPTHVQSGGSGLVFLPEAAGRPALRPTSSPRRVTPSRRPPLRRMPSRGRRCCRRFPPIGSPRPDVDTGVTPVLEARRLRPRQSPLVSTPNLVFG